MLLMKDIKARRLPMWLHEVGSGRLSQSETVESSISNIDRAKIQDGATYPTAPQVNVSSKTLIDGSFRNLSITPCLSFCATLPSYLRDGIEACLRPASTILRVIFQEENTTLYAVSHTKTQIPKHLANKPFDINRLLLQVV